MTIEIRLTEAQEARLREMAAAKLMDVNEFVRQIIFDKIGRPSLDELLAPIDAASERAGLTEAEIDVIVERGRNEYWQERQKKATDERRS